MNVATAIQRLAKEKKQLDSSRVCDFYVSPLDGNVFEWHFTIRGPVNSPFAEGLYHGYLRFTKDYPFSPPEAAFLTPSGRFEVGKPICSSVSSYHPELWRPQYDIALVLVALRAFMAQDEEPGIGALSRRYITKEEKERLARESRCFACETCGMKSAEDIWRMEMEGRPPVSHELEALVPEIPPGATATTNADCDAAAVDNSDRDAASTSVGIADNSMVAGDVEGNAEPLAIPGGGVTGGVRDKESEVETDSKKDAGVSGEVCAECETTAFPKHGCEPAVLEADPRAHAQAPRNRA
ncbi:putative Ubiquitin conjugating enzyme [Trypanosoma vivax]|nr:putative Ubiquitin conjugating enzyme [Trypanosoma vivax]